MRHAVMAIALCSFCAALSTEQLIDCFLRAMGMTQMPAKAVYAELGLSQTQWSRQTTGAEPPRFLSRLGQLQSDGGQRVVQWFLSLALHHAGLPEELTTAGETSRGLKRMAKADLDPQERRQVS